MKSKLLLRIASGLMFLHTIGHTLGILPSNKPPNASIEKVVSDMHSNTFEFMGRTSSLGSFYNGYGVIALFMIFWTSILLWILSNDPVNRLTKKLLPVLFLFLFCMGIAEYIYFFPFAAALTLLAAFLVGIVFLKRNV